MFQYFTVGKFCQIISHADITVVKVHQLNVFLILPGTKYKADWLILTLGHIVFFKPTQI